MVFDINIGIVDHLAVMHRRATPTAVKYFDTKDNR
jgi:hypothetical protein